MTEKEQITELKRLWLSRNPQHDTNADTDFQEDMFWGTVLCVFNDFEKIINAPQTFYFLCDRECQGENQCSEQCYSCADMEKYN